MPRGDGAFKIEAVKPEVSPVLLVQILDIPEINNPSRRESVYLTDAQENQNHSGQIYYACGLTFDAVEVSTKNEVDQCRLRLDNVSNEFTALVQRVEMNGVHVVVRRGFLETLGSADGAQTIFEGHIESCVISEYAIEALVQTDFSLKTQIPRRLYWVHEFPHIPSSKDPRQIFKG